MSQEKECFSCLQSEMTVFYEMENAPVLSVELLQDRDVALNFPTGEIALGFCNNCGFISNLHYDPSLHDYSNEYESTQSYSTTYDTFAHRMAEDLVTRHSLYRKTILEIGCGQGEFLRLLCDIGRNWGIGYDPAYIDNGQNERAKRSLNGSNNGQVTFIKEYFSENHSDHNADLIICKMTLEHIHQPYKFINMIRKAIGDRVGATLFIQVPNVTRILRELAFWDVYYEHCSYFSSLSLSKLFTKAGFHVLKVGKEYRDQYLVLEAKPNSGSIQVPGDPENDIHLLRRDVSYFSKYSKRRVMEWKQSIIELASKGNRIVLWGGGSKAVAFLTTLGISDEVAYVVDINPKKDGTFLAGTGQQVVSPTFLQSYDPNTVIVMNPIYISEISAQLKDMGLDPELLAV